MPYSIPTSSGMKPIFSTTALPTRRLAGFSAACKSGVPRTITEPAIALSAWRREMIPPISSSLAAARLLAAALRCLFVFRRNFGLRHFRGDGFLGRLVDEGHPQGGLLRVGVEVLVLNALLAER